MAVIAAVTATALSNATGFTRTLYDNISSFSSTYLSLSTARVVAFTPSAAENCQGVIIELNTNANAPSTMKSVTVELRESTVVRATKTFTASQIANGTSSNGDWRIYFPFTSAYAVTTSAATWDIRISNATGTNDWRISTSDATNPFLVVVGSTLGAYTNNTDQIACIGKLTIDQNFTFKGKLGTGETVNSVCGFACTQPDPTPDNVAAVIWDGSTGRTGNLDGLFVLATQSGWRMGTSTSRISRANKAILNTIAATSGTATKTGFASTKYSTTTTSAVGRVNFFFYGEIPAVEDAVITVDCAVGSTSIVTDVATGWVSGDEIFIGGMDTQGMGVTTIHTVTSSSTTTVNFSPATVTYTRKALVGHIINYTGYGIEINGYTSASAMNLGAISNFQASGVAFQTISFIGATNGGTASESVANLGTYSNYLSHCCIRGNNTFGSTLLDHSIGVTPSYFEHVNAFMHAAINTRGTGAFYVTFDNCIFIRTGGGNWSTITSPSTSILTFTNNSLENGNVTATNFAGVSCVSSNNNFWGFASNGAWRVDNQVNYTGTNNQFNKCSQAMQPINMPGAFEYNSKYGNITANTIDIDISAAGYADFTFVNCMGNMTTNPAFGSSPSTSSNLPTGILKWDKYNQTANDSRAFLKNGTYQQCGSGLTDTTTSPAGNYTLRMRPTDTNGLLILAYPQLAGPSRSIILSNQIGKSVTVSAQIKIANAAYYGGTSYQLPRMYIKYDNATTIYFELGQTTNWQQAALTFIPATTYGSFEWWITGMSNASSVTPNFYTDFYVGDISVQYPAGTVSIDLGKLNDWAFGLPPFPPIAIIPPPGKVWDELLSLHTISGTAGYIVNQILNVVSFIKSYLIIK